MTLGHSYVYFNIYHVYLLCKCIICLHMTIGKWCFWKACTKHVTTHDIHDDHPLPAMVHIGHGSNIVHWRGNFCIGAQYPYVPNPKSQTPQLDCYYYETSALNGEGIKKLFNDLVIHNRELKLKKINDKEDSSISNNLNCCSTCSIL